MPPKRRDGLRNCRFDGARVGDVRCDAMASPPSCAMMDGGFLGGLLHEVDAGDAGAFPCIGDGRRLAVAPARPRGSCPEHDGGLALQAINH